MKYILLFLAVLALAVEVVHAIRHYRFVSIIACLATAATLLGSTL